MSFDRILIPTDGSDLASKGLMKGIELAKLLHADVTVVTVTEPQPNSMHPDGMSWERDAPSILPREVFEARRARQILDEARRRVTAAGVACDIVHVGDRPTAAGIVHVAKEKRSTLIVMATHTGNRILSWLRRSQTRKVLAHSPVPVLVVT